MTNSPSFFVLCPDIQEPIGGIKVLYRLVDVLNGLGFQAYLVHDKRNFKCAWFDHNTKIVYFKDAYITKKDILITPECYGQDIVNIHKGIKKIIFNQGAYLSFSGHPISPGTLKMPYKDKDIIATVVVSSDSERYLRFALPGLSVHRIKLSINPDIFSCGTYKKKQIAFMPRKLLDDATQVINILRSRDILRDYHVVPIHNKPEKMVAKILKDSLIFLSFSHQEGCPLPPMEAMACGCIVIGYTGGGANEYFNPAFSYPVLDSDIIGFAKAVEGVIKIQEEKSSALSKKSRLASKYILENYSPENEARAISKVWNKILKGW